MAQSRTVIQKRSDMKRGVKVWGSKFPISFIENLKSLSHETGYSQVAIVIEAVTRYEQELRAMALLSKEKSPPPPARTIVF